MIRDVIRLSPSQLEVGERQNENNVNNSVLSTLTGCASKKDVARMAGWGERVTERVGGVWEC